MTQRKLTGLDPWQNAPRTPGPLGINDAAAPASGLPGPTPGSWGINDGSPGSNLGIGRGLMSADESGTGSGGGSGAGSGACSDVEIEINNTPATDDDLVLLKYAMSNMTSSTPCRVRAKGKAGGFTVVLTNPDGRILFGGNKQTLTVSVPAGGGWANFDISGAKGSDKLNDALIEAHCETEKGKLIGKKEVTVVWFDQAKMEVKAAGTYVNIGDVTFTAGGKAVTLSASARIRPERVNCAAPQIADLRVGIIQNSLPLDGASARTRKVFYGPPEMIWDPAVPDGTKVQLPDQWQRSFSSNVVSNDSTPAADPLYQLPKGKNLHRPAGCDTEAGTKGTTESSDNPGTPLGDSIWVRVSDGSGGSGADKEPARFESGTQIEVAPVIGGKGKTLGWAKYPFRQTTLQQKFLDWAVIYNKSTKEFLCLRQTSWALNLDSNDSGKLQAAPAGSDSDPTQMPVTTGKFSNDINDDMKNWNNGPMGTKTVPQVKSPSSSTTSSAIMPSGIP